MRDAGFELLDSPFEHRLEVNSHAPGDARLTTQLSLPTHTRPVLLHWEVAREVRFAAVERYGLFIAHPDSDYQVSVDLCGLEPGRWYWARMWAGGSWSRCVRLQTRSHASDRSLRRELSAATPPTGTHPATRAWSLLSTAS